MPASAPHTSPVPKVGIGEWMRAMQQMNEPARERDGGDEEWARAQKLEWLLGDGSARRSSRTSELGDEVSFLSHLLWCKKKFFCVTSTYKRDLLEWGWKRIKSGDTERGAVAANGVLVRSLDNTWDSGWVTVLDSITYIHPGTIAVAIWQEAQPLALHKQTSSLQHLLHRGALSKGMFHFTELPHAEARAARSASWFCSDLESATLHVVVSSLVQMLALRKKKKKKMQNCFFCLLLFGKPPLSLSWKKMEKRSHAHEFLTSQRMDSSSWNKTLLIETKETFDLNKSPPTKSVNNTRVENGMVNNRCMMNIFPHFWKTDLTEIRRYEKLRHHSEQHFNTPIRRLFPCVSAHITKTVPY